MRGVPESRLSRGIRLRPCAARPDAGSRTRTLWRLKRFPACLQQLTMESKGKSVTIERPRVDFQTGPHFQDKVLPAMRFQFGGHVEKPGAK